MDNLDYAMQTELIEASQYFSSRVKNIYATSLDGKILSFKDISFSKPAFDGLYLSPWALMRLEPSDELVHGCIHLPRSYYDYSWTRFRFHNAWYIYTCVSKHVYPEEVFIDTYKPDNITFRQTKQEILDQLLTEAYAYQIDDFMWQFKAKLKIAGSLGEVLSGYNFTAFDKARITICDQKIQNFIGYGCHAEVRL